MEGVVGTVHDVQAGLFAEACRGLRDQVQVGEGVARALQKKHGQLDARQVRGAFGGGLFSGTVASVTPAADAVTLREHHTFAELPDANYKPRAADPRAGFFGVQYLDYAAPLGTSMMQYFIQRHRLEKVDPSARVSEAKKPIVYYVDRGTPEPIRSALL